ncbi:ThuA domain-containing protein [Lacipirellula sp.]|uniref:ThuA domain-containing protein n=1 Tax=Lacipirellula sp. TaxID=2691419 RepID=UPI003D0F330E
MALQNRRQALLNIAGAAIGVGLSNGALRLGAAESQQPPLRVCMLSGSEEYKSDESLAAFQAEVERNYPIKCSRAFATAVDNLLNLDALSSCDVMLLFTRRLKIDGKQLDAVKEYCLSGRPIVGLRTASHAFENWLDLDRQVFGGDYRGHYGSGVFTRISLVETKHPALAGVTPFESSEKLYKNPQLAPDTTLLLRGDRESHQEPVAWTRINNGGRVFYTSLGGPSDFKTTQFRKLLINAIFWVAERDEREQP